MGFYVNPGNENFRKILAGDIFVDKSMLLAELNRRIGTADCFVCVSRPRRFGKTMAERMIAAYYSKGCDSSELFKPLKVSEDRSFAEHLNRYNVLHVDMNAFLSDYGKDAIVRLKSDVVDDFKRTFSDLDLSWCSTISNCIMEVYRSTSVPFVVIFDEYDSIFRESGSDSLTNDCLMLLNALFKSDAMLSCIALAYLTGILPIIRDKAQSKLNNFDEYTFLSPGMFAKYSGFTEDEVRALCESHNMDFNECKRWYDGYRFKGYDIYSPRSVVSAMQKGEFKAYWNSTSQYEAILDPIRLDADGMRSDIMTMMGGGSVGVNATLFLNTSHKLRNKDDVFTYLCHLGYLAYDDQTHSCRIPNREIRDEWVNALTVSGDYSSLIRMIGDSKRLLESVWALDVEAASDALSAAHERVTSNMTYNNEACFQSAIRLAFFYADSFYTIVLEYPAGKGYVDIAFIPYKPNIPAMVVELKAKGTAGTALDQIRERRCFAGLDRYEGNTLLVGVSYDKDTKRHECVIERH